MMVTCYLHLSVVKSATAFWSPLSSLQRLGQIWSRLVNAESCRTLGSSLIQSKVSLTGKEQYELPEKYNKIEHKVNQSTAINCSGLFQTACAGRWFKHCRNLMPQSSRMKVSVVNRPSKIMMHCVLFGQLITLCHNTKSCHKYSPHQVRWHTILMYLWPQGMYLLAGRAKYSRRASPSFRV